MSSNTDPLLNESRTSCNTKTSEERDYYELNSLIYHIRCGDHTNNSVLSISKIDKSNSMLSNKDIWDVNNNKDDTSVFYHKIEEFKKGRGLTNKLSKQLEDYNDDLDEKVDVMKTDHIQQLSNKECKLNNLRQINCITNNEIHNPHNNCVSINPNYSNRVYDFNPIAQAIYFTPQQKQIKLNVANEIMNLRIVPRQLHFGPQNNDCENTKTHSPHHWNSYKEAIVFPNSKFDSPYQAWLNNSQVKTSFNAKQSKEQSRVKYNQTNHSNSQCASSGANEAVSQKINIEDIIIGKDKRTTLMLRNIPNKYTLNNILEEISSSFWGKYDYINLPIDNDRKLNLGYAFINFTDPFHIIGFYDAYRSRKWLKHKSDKKMDMNYADKQGKRENNGKDIQSNYFAEEDKRFNLSTLQIKTEIPVKHLNFFKKIYPNSVCIVDDKDGMYSDKCFVVKSIGKK